MSTSAELDEANLARETEKAAVAKAKAELEAEREAMRAEIAAIEEEERLEAERTIQEAIKAMNSNSCTFLVILASHLSYGLPNPGN